MEIIIEFKNMITGNVITKIEEVEFTIELMVWDLQASLDFYTKVLGFQLHRITTDRKFAIIIFGKSIVMLYQVKDLPEPRFGGLEIRFIVADVDSYCAEIVRRGAVIEKPIFNAPYGLRQFFLKDLDGAMLKFASVIN